MTSPKSILIISAADLDLSTEAATEFEEIVELFDDSQADLTARGLADHYRELAAAGYRRDDYRNQTKYSDLAARVEGIALSRVHIAPVDRYAAPMLDDLEQWVLSLVRRLEASAHAHHASSSLSYLDARKAEIRIAFGLARGALDTGADVTDDDIETRWRQAINVGGQQDIAALCASAMGNPMSDSHGNKLDPATSRARIVALIRRERANPSDPLSERNGPTK